MTFTVFILLAQVFLSQVPSLMIGVYSSLYMNEERGFRVSCNLVMSTIGGIATSFLFGHFWMRSKWLSTDFMVHVVSAFLFDHSFSCLPFTVRGKASLINNLGNVLRIPLEDSVRKNTDCMDVQGLVLS